MSDEKLDLILQKTIRIETALWPDDGQPGVLTKHDSRLDEVEEWQNTWESRVKTGSTIIGALWVALTTALGIHLGSGKH